ncbi:MAG: hypothetical protein MUE81_06325 [Thermoflexibacter sp.]|jgi:chromosome segregation ATPase|nr:hypothetical protein [Thermoflexibacter sp.]
MLLKKLKSYWLSWKARFGKTAPKKVGENDDPITKVEREIAKMKADLLELKNIHSEFKANRSILSNDIGYLNHLIIKNNDKIQKLEQQEALTNNDRKEIDKYENENKKYQLEIQGKEEKRKNLSEEMVLLETQTNLLAIEIRDNENNLRLATARIKILSAQKNFETSEEQLRMAFQKLEELAKKVEQKEQSPLQK